MKALFTKDCLDWVGHLIIQATIWKQRSKLKAKCGLLRKKLLVCVLQILLHACIFQSNVVFCSCKAKAKWSKHALYTFNLTFNYIKCAWGNISVIKSGPSFISKSASSKKKKKRKKVRVRSCDQAQVMLLTSSTRSAKGGWGSLRLHWTTATRMQRWRCR